VKLQKEDAFATSYAAASFDVVASIRFLFHFEDARPLLTEAARLLRPGGLLVCDTLRWSPRTRLAPVQKLLGGRVWTRRNADFERDLEASGFTVMRRIPVLLLPSMVYRGVPGPLLGPLAALEARLPEGLRTKVFWLAERRA
jgi:SAM-dependent methyltransferase